MGAAVKTSISNIAWDDVLIGDFDADGDDDITGRSNGDWWVAKSDEVRFLIEHWGAWSSGVAWSDVMAGVHRRSDNGGNNEAGIDLEKRITYRTFESAVDAVLALP